MKTINNFLILEGGIKKAKPKLGKFHNYNPTIKTNIVFLILCIIDCQLSHYQSIQFLSRVYRKHTYKLDGLPVNTFVIHSFFRVVHNLKSNFLLGRAPFL